MWPRVTCSGVLHLKLRPYYWWHCASVRFPSLERDGREQAIVVAACNSEQLVGCGCIVDAGRGCHHVVGVRGFGVRGYHQQVQSSEAGSEHRYDVRPLLVGTDDYLVALVFDAQWCWGPVAFVVEHAVD